MSRDVSDPTLAATTERNVRARFFVALLPTIPAVLYSPLGRGITGSVGALYPRFGMMLWPARSAFLISRSSIVVAVNAVALRRVDRRLVTPG